ncbi:recombinase family protein [Micromonospora sp. NPDC050795]|uniref:recombinase family protein n=1 Tax=Micromonospora sp. NPDC050795 TaxID=3364282 RepID=UPI00378EB27B
MLGVIRLSREREESTSVVRQRAYITTWAEQNGHTIVGWAEDEGVSGSVPPGERPQLGKWLPTSLGGKADAPAFDILCAWRLDRISRRVLHLAALMDWCKSTGRAIVSTSEGFDINSPMGAVFVNILAALAEGELEAIRERARSSFAHLMKEGRWRGGFVPYGYQAVKADAGKGWRLDVDPETSKVAREIVRRIVGGESTNSVVRWLNETATPSPLDAQRKRAGKATTGTEWRVANLLKMLRSHTLLGYAEMTETRAKPDGTKETFTRLVRGEDGLPLRRADPIIDAADWERLQETLRKNANPNSGNRVGGSPLLRVAYCECGEPVYRNRGRAGMYYRCGLRARAGRNCPKGMTSIPAHLLEHVTEQFFLLTVGHLEVQRRVFVPGSDHAANLADVEESLAELREHLDAGMFRGERGRAEFRQMYGALEARREALEALPSEPDRWELEPTGQTYRQRWESLTTVDERNREMREAGLKVIVRGVPTEEELEAMDDPDEHSRVRVILPEDLMERVQAHAAKTA